MNMVNVPDRSVLGQIEKLCNLSEPYGVSDQLDLAFINAMNENIEWHRNKSDFYRTLLDQKGFVSGSLSSISDIEKVPFILANFFKKHEVLSVPKEEIFLHLTSSGTTGQKSQIFFDQWSITSAQGMVDKIFDYNGWITPDQSCNYLLYSYEPENESRLGTAYTDNFLCKYAPVENVTYALRCIGKGKHKFDFFGVLEALKRYQEDGRPVRIFGFPSFLYFTLTQMKELGVPPLKLNKDSLVFLGGGWKGHQDKAISKVEFYKLANEMLGIPDARLRDGFGSVEHCVPYIECTNHKFHVPVWSRVLVRDVKTLKPLPYGETGYLNFISPYITSVPANSVLMGDLVTLHSGQSCSCELKTPYFDVLGRAGMTKNKSCAVAASELLKEVAS